MIHSQDRSGYFGASDTCYVLRDNHQTVSWKKFWNEKLGGISQSNLSFAMKCGNAYEHAILDAIDPNIEKDGQIIIQDKLIRVNYDGYKDGIIYEAKTKFRGEDGAYKMTIDHWRQCQVEMYVYQEMCDQWFLPPFKKLYLVSYSLYETDRQKVSDGLEITADDIDPNRINMEEVKYDKKFINKEYLKRVERLAKALRKGKFPA